MSFWDLFCSQMSVTAFKDGLIIVLSFFFVRALFRIRRLHQLLKAEQQRMLIPVLMPEIDPTGPVIFLKNESLFYAKDILIEEVKVKVVYDFSKELIFKFEDVAFLNPQQKVELKYQIFDGPYRIGPSDSANVIPHLSRSVFKMQLRYANIENRLFRAHIVVDKNKSRVEEIVPYQT